MINKRRTNKILNIKNILSTALLVFTLAVSFTSHSREALPEEVEFAKCKAGFNLINIESKRIIHVLVSGDNVREFTSACVETLEEMTASGFTLNLQPQANLVIVCSKRVREACQ